MCSAVGLQRRYQTDLQTGMTLPDLVSERGPAGRVRPAEENRFRTFSYQIRLKSSGLQKCRCRHKRMGLRYIPSTHIPTNPNPPTGFGITDRQSLVVGTWLSAVGLFHFWSSRRGKRRWAVWDRPGQPFNAIDGYMPLIPTVFSIVIKMIVHNMSSTPC